MKAREPKDIIKALRLGPLLPEGGYYRESYRCPATLTINRSGSRCSRSMATAIYYLLTPDSFSALHRLAGDELYHFYLGNPVRMLLLYPDGTGRVELLGPDILKGQRVQLAIPAGVWQGAALEAGGRYALLGTTLSPGYEPKDFSLGDRASLTRDYPRFAQQISKLTR